jgi:hypothetical protein
MYFILIATILFRTKLFKSLLSNAVITQEEYRLVTLQKVSESESR